MQKYKGRTLFSEGDLAHLDCARATTLALQDLEAALAGGKDGYALRLIRPQGSESISFRPSAEEGPR